jgi:putative ABC transport system permease protein
MQDIRYAFRTLRRDVLFTLSTVVTLGLGIGLVTGFFAIVHAVLLQPLAPHGDTVVRIWKVDADRSLARFPISYPELKLWRDSAKSVQALAAIRYAETSAGAVIVDNEPAPLTLAPVSADFFKVVHGGSPLVGRWFTAADEGNADELAAVVSERFWRRLSGGDPSFVGRRLLFPGGKRALVVVGVAPDNLEFPNETDAWVPLDGYFRPEPGGIDGLDIRSRRFWNFHFVARLRPGVTIDEARAELDVLSRGIATQFPDDLRVMPIEVEPLLDATLGTLRPLTLLLFAGAALVFLAAGGNVAALLVMRAATRTREIAVRIALGAGRFRIARQVIAESLLVGAAGALCGMGIAQLCVVLAKTVASTQVPRLGNAAIDGAVLTFCVLATVGWVVTLGTMPLWRGRSANALELTPHLATRTTRSHRTLRVMIVAQVIAAVIVATAAGLLVRSFSRLLAVDRGFDVSRLAVLELLLPELQQSQTAGERAAFFSRLIPAIAALPGVEAATTVHLGPGTAQAGLSARMMFQGQAPAEARNNPYATFEPVLPAYFETLGIRMREGRAFTESDDHDAPAVAIVSESVARRYWPGQNPIGKRLQFLEQSPWTTVVGVAADTRYRELTRDWLTVYFPARQFSFFWPGAVVVRTTGDAGARLNDIRRALQTAAPGLTVHEAATMEQLVAKEVVRPRTAVAVAIIFTAMAILVAAIGVYAVFAYDLTHRGRELAVRAALGASPRRIVIDVLRTSLALGAIGAVAGLVAASLLTRSLQAILFEVTPLDAASFAAAGIGLLAVVVAASTLPARRAARINPVSLLRTE